VQCSTFTHVGGFATHKEVLARRGEEIDHLRVYLPPKSGSLFCPPRSERFTLLRTLAGQRHARLSLTILGNGLRVQQAWVAQRRLSFFLCPP
jgi:hypothetical protein